MNKYNSLDRIEDIRLELERYNYVIDEQKKSFNERLDRLNEYFDRMQEFERMRFEKNQK